MNPKRDSSGSQFFIDVHDQPSLDAGGYTVFGEVISGMETVDKIVALATDPATLKGPMGPNPAEEGSDQEGFADAARRGTEAGTRRHRRALTEARARMPAKCGAMESSVAPFRFPFVSFRA